MFKVVLKLPDKQKPKFKMNRNVCQRAGLSPGGGTAYERGGDARRKF